MHQHMGHLGLGLVVAVHFGDDEMSAWFEDALHFSQDRLQVWHVVQGVGDANGIERSVEEIHLCCIHPNKADGFPGEGLFEGGSAFLTGVNADDLVKGFQVFEQGKDEVAVSGGDIQHAPGIQGLDIFSGLSIRFSVWYFGLLEQVKDTAFLQF
jgi:hypothetical protein